MRRRTYRADELVPATATHFRCVLCREQVVTRPAVSRAPKHCGAFCAPEHPQPMEN